MRVLKFGGGITSDVEAIKKIPAVIRQWDDGETVLVFSAFGKTTNKLEELAVAFDENETAKVAEMLSEIKIFHLNIATQLFSSDDKTKNKLCAKIEELFGYIVGIGNRAKNSFQLPLLKDQITAVGEMLATLIMSFYLRYEEGFDNVLVFAPDIIKTNSNFGKAKINEEETFSNIKSEILPLLKIKRKIVIVQGFIAGVDFLPPGRIRMKISFITTLGREGSDYTAAIFGFALDADGVFLFKNVPGVMDKDPNVPGGENARIFRKLDYERAESILEGTAKRIIFTETVSLLKRKRIPIIVVPFSNPKKIGTIIS